MATFYQFTKEGFLEAIVQTELGIPQGRYMIRYEEPIPEQYQTGNIKLTFDSGSRSVSFLEPLYHPNNVTIEIDNSGSIDEEIIEYPVQTGWKVVPGSPSINIPPEDIFFTGSIG